MTNLAGIAPIEHTKALTHIMHYTIQMNFNAQIPHSLNELKFYFNNFSSHTLDVQGKSSNRFAPFMAVQFFHAMVSTWSDIIGMVKFLHSI